MSIFSDYAKTKKGRIAKAGVQKYIKARAKYGINAHASAGINYQKALYKNRKSVATDNAIKKQHKEPQVKRNVVQKALDLVSAPAAAVAGGVYNGLRGKSIAKGAWSSFKAALPNSKNTTKMRNFGNVFDAYQNYAHKRGRVTATDEALRAMGQAKITRNTIGHGGATIVSPTSPNHNSVRDTTYYRLSRMANGFIGDTVADPLNYVGGVGAEATGKILKGSGASLSQLKKIAKEDQVAGNVRKVVDHLYSLDKPIREEKISNGVTGKAIYNRLFAGNGVLDGNSTESVSKAEKLKYCQDAANTFNSVIQKLPTSPEERRDISIGFNRAPFATKRMKSLSARILKDENLRKLGDYTISPYYNELAQKLRTSRLGKAFSRNNQFFSAMQNGINESADYAVLHELLSKQGLAALNNQTSRAAMKMKDLFNGLSEEDQLDVVHAIDNGTFKEAVTYFNALKQGDVTDLETDMDKSQKAIFSARDKRDAEIRNAVALLGATPDNVESLKTNPARFLFHAAYGRTPDLSTSDRDVLGLYNILINDSRLYDLDVNATALNILEHRATEQDYEKLAKTQLRYTHAPVSSLFDNMVRYYGWDKMSGWIATYGLRKNPDPNLSSRIFEEQKNNPASKFLNSEKADAILKRGNYSGMSDKAFYQADERLKSTPETYALMRDRAANDGDALYRAYNAVKNTAMAANSEATIKGALKLYDETGLDYETLNAANDLIKRVESKLTHGKQSSYTLKDVLLDLNESERKALVDAWVDDRGGIDDFFDWYGKGNQYDSDDNIQKLQELVHDNGKSMLDEYAVYSHAYNQAQQRKNNILSYIKNYDSLSGYLNPSQLKSLKNLEVIESILHADSGKSFTSRITDAIKNLGDFNDDFVTINKIIDKYNDPNVDMSEFGDDLSKVGFILGHYEDLDDKPDKIASEIARGKNALAKYGNTADSTKYQLSSLFSNEMSRIGKLEKTFGELNKKALRENRDSYVYRMLTDEAKDYFNSVRGFKKNGSFRSIFSPGKNFNIKRTNDFNIEQANNYFKSKYGFNIFKTNLLDIYQARALTSNQLLYSDMSSQFLKDMFSIPADGHGMRVYPDPETGELKINFSGNHDVVHALYKDFNKSLNKTIGRTVNFEAERAVEDAVNNFESVLTDAIKNKDNSKLIRAGRTNDVLKQQLHDLKLQKTYLEKMRDLTRNAVDLNDFPGTKGINEALEKYDNFRQRVNKGEIEDDAVHRYGEKVRDLLAGRQNNMLQTDKEYATFHDLCNEIEEINGDIESFERILNNNTQYGRYLQDALNGKPIDDIVEDFEKLQINKWLKDNGAERSEKLREEYLDDIFGKADDPDKAVRQRRMCYANNIPIQELTREQAERALNYIDPSNFVFFDKDIIPRVNIMSRAQEIEGKNAFLNFFDNYVMLKYKQANTVPDPSFHVQNALGNAFQSFLAIGSRAINPRRLKLAYSVLEDSDPNAVIRLGGKEYTKHELLEYAKQMGVIDEAFTRYELAGKANDILENGIRTSSAIKHFRNIKTPFSKNLTKMERFNTINPLSTSDIITQFGSVIGSNIETVQRMNIFMSALDEGHSMKMALKKVNDFMFDYSDLTDFEKGWMRRIIPFYTYMRKNIPMELENLLKQPQKYSGFAHLQDEIEDSDADSIPTEWRNQWRQNYVQIPGTEIGVDFKMPWEQLDRLDMSKMENGWEPKAFGRLLGSTNPFIKAAVELPTNRSQYVDMPLADDGKMSKDDYIKYLLGQTIYGNAMQQIEEADNYSNYYNSKLSDAENKAINDKRNRQNNIKNLTSHLAFPVAHISDMGDYKKHTNSFVDKNGKKITYPSYLTQEQSDKIYNDVYIKESKLRKENNRIIRSAAYENSVRISKRKGEPILSFKEWQNKWYHSKDQYKNYCELQKDNGKKPKSYEEWAKEDTYKYTSKREVG